MGAKYADPIFSRFELIARKKNTDRQTDRQTAGTAICGYGSAFSQSRQSSPMQLGDWMIWRRNREQDPRHCQCIVKQRSRLRYRARKLHRNQSTALYNITAAAAAAADDATIASRFQFNQPIFQGSLQVRPGPPYISQRRTFAGVGYNYFNYLIN